MTTLPTNSRSALRSQSAILLRRIWCPVIATVATLLVSQAAIADSRPIVQGQQLDQPDTVQSFPVGGRQLDPKAIPQFGLVAEQVEKVNPDLVARDEEGKPYTVRYEAVNAMLLNEFLKAHKKVETQTSEIADLKATVAEVKAALQAQAAQLQKVSDRLEASRLAPTVVANN